MANKTWVDLDSIQTLVNKVLTAPTINGGSISGAVITTPTGDVVTLTGSQTLTNKTLTSPVINTPTVAGGVVNPKQAQYTLVVVTYSASMAIDATQGNIFSITATNNTAFTINTPSGGLTGQEITITIRNTSGGALGTATFQSGYKMTAWTQPANGFSRSIIFYYDGTNWIEKGRTAADVTT